MTSTGSTSQAAVGKLSPERGDRVDYGGLVDERDLHEVGIAHEPGPFERGGRFETGLVEPGLALEPRVVEPGRTGEAGMPEAGIAQEAGERKLRRPAIVAIVETRRAHELRGSERQRVLELRSDEPGVP